MDIFNVTNLTCGKNYGNYGNYGFDISIDTALKNKDQKALKEALHQFEEIFLQMLYKQMKVTIPKSELFPEDRSKEILNSMFDETLIKEVSKNRGLGLADTMYKQLHAKIKTNHSK
jgi:flagellar protein FlgJ